MQERVRIQTCCITPLLIVLLCNTINWYTAFLSVSSLLHVNVKWHGEYHSSCQIGCVGHHVLQFWISCFHWSNFCEYGVVVTINISICLVWMKFVWYACVLRHSKMRPHADLSLSLSFPLFLFPSFLSLSFFYYFSLCSISSASSYVSAKPLYLQLSSYLMLELSWPYRRAPTTNKW